MTLSTNPIYIATAHVDDKEFQKRILRHQARRGPQWINIEEEKYLSRHNIYNKVAVIDCVTLWCTNFFYSHIMSEQEQPSVDEAFAEIKAEFDKFTDQEGIFIFVTNEIGSGGVSSNAVQRHFTDLEGWINQYIASKANEVYLMVSGISVKIK